MIRPSLAATAALVSIALTQAACGEDAPYGGELVKSTAPRASAADVTAAERTAAVAGNTAFAFDLHAAIRNQPGNLFYSPHSISLALAMTWAGAKGETERQMADALHFALPQQRQHAAFNALALELASRGKGNGKFRLNIVNQAWGQTGYSFAPTYLDTLAASYGAGLRLLDFAGEADTARLTINEWVEHETEGRIVNLLPDGVVESTTRLVLTNAIYFKAAWDVPFQPGETRDGSFAHLDGTLETVPMMHGTLEGRHSAVGGLQAVELPYDGNDLSMVILLPDAGRMAEVEAAPADHIGPAVAALQEVELVLAMPRFQFEYVLGLADTLAAMGMPLPFSDAADFTGIGGNGSDRLVLKDVLHKAWVNVNEAGTEAAAATAAVIGDASQPERITVDIDRPFLFLIRDRKTGAVLFMGRVVDP